MIEIYLPKLDALWDHYYSFPLAYIKKLWAENKKIFNEEVEPIKTIPAWHYLVVLTEILKMRREWDYTIMRPKGEQQCDMTSTLWY